VRGHSIKNESKAYEPGGCPPRLGQSRYFWAKAKFFGQKPTSKHERIFLYLLNEKMELIPSSEIKCPKSGIFTNNYWVR